jgi:hypothetical protein
MTIVLALEWDGGGPANSGEVTIRRTRKGFLVDDDVETRGPFNSVDDALACDSFHFSGTPAPHLRCLPSFAASPSVLQAGFDLAGEVGGTVRINGVLYQRTDDGLVQVT